MTIFLGDEIGKAEYEQLIIDQETFNLLHDQARLLLKAHRLAHEMMMSHKNRAVRLADEYYQVHQQMKELKAKIVEGHERLKKSPEESRVEVGGGVDG